MDPIDSELDERLRAASKPPSDAVARVTARAMSAAAPRRRPGGRLLAAAAAASILAGIAGLRYWPHAPVFPKAEARPAVGIVAIRAPDGSSTIYSTGTDEDTVPPGSGFVISEGEPR